MCRWAAGPNAGSGARASRLASVSAAAPAVEISGLVKRYGRTTAVDGLSLRAERGTVTAVLGPNGAGKTTTISMIAGLLERDGGEVVVAGEPMTTHAIRAKSAIGYVPQDLAIYPDLSARENLVFFARLYGMPTLMGVTGSVPRRTPAP